MSRRVSTIRRSTSASPTRIRQTTTTGTATPRLWIILAWIILGISWLPPTADCFVARVMRSFLLRQQRRGSLWFASTSATAFSVFGGRQPLPTVPSFAVVQAADNPRSPQSYFDRHSRLFASSSSVASSSSPSFPSSSSPSSAFYNPSNFDSINDMETSTGEFTDYEKWVRRLYMTNMFHPVKMGLTNMKKLHDIMGNPMDEVRSE